VGLNLTWATGWKTKIKSRSGSVGMFNNLLSVGHLKALSALWRKLHSSQWGISTFPSDTTKEAGYFVGFGESISKAMMVTVL
jgi:hypothetical protein